MPGICRVWLMWSPPCCISAVKWHRYAHDEPGAFAAGEIYLPEGLEGRRWYHPTDRGTEARIAEKLRGLAELNQAAWKAGKGRRRGQG